MTLVERLYGTTDQYILRLVEPKVDDPLAVSVTLAKDANFEWAEPDFIQQWRKLDTPNDTLFNSQWHQLNTGQGMPAGVAGADSRITQAWDFASGNGTAVIAVIDDGVQLAHPDLAGRIFVNPARSRATASTTTATATSTTSTAGTSSTTTTTRTRS